MRGRGRRGVPGCEGASGRAAVVVRTRVRADRDSAKSDLGLTPQGTGRDSCGCQGSCRLRLEKVSHACGFL